MLRVAMANVHILERNYGGGRMPINSITRRLHQVFGAVMFDMDSEKSNETNLCWLSIYHAGVLPLYPQIEGQ